MNEKTLRKFLGILEEDVGTVCSLDFQSLWCTNKIGASVALKDHLEYWYLSKFVQCKQSMDPRPLTGLGNGRMTTNNRCRDTSTCMIAWALGATKNMIVERSTWIPIRSRLSGTRKASIQSRYARSIVEWTLTNKEIISASQKHMISKYL
jgi:hypothetical protein